MSLEPSLKSTVKSKSNLHGFELHRPSSKGTNLLFHVIKATINLHVDSTACHHDSNPPKLNHGNPVHKPMPPRIPLARTQALGSHCFFSKLIQVDQEICKQIQLPAKLLDSVISYEVIKAISINAARSVTVRYLISSNVCVVFYVITFTPSFVYSPKCFHLFPSTRQLHSCHGLVLDSFENRASIYASESRPFHMK